MYRLARHTTLRQLQIFEAVGRLKNFTRAAEELFLSQSTVSSQIKHLTEIAGAPLVEYINKQVYLTEAGHHLFNACQEVFRSLDRVDAAISDIKGIKAGTLKVCVITTAKYFAPEVLGRFARHYPDIEVGLQILNLEGVLARLRANEDDIYIIGNNPPLDMEIEALPFAPNPLYVMASRDHPLALQKRRLTLQELAEQPLIVREAGSGIRAVLEKMFSNKGLNPRIRMVLSSNEAIKHAVIGQLGLAAMPLLTILTGGPDGPVTVLDVENFPVQRKWHAVYPKSKEISVLARTFLEFLSEEGERLSGDLDRFITAIQEQHKNNY